MEGWTVGRLKADLLQDCFVNRKPNVRKCKDCVSIDECDSCGRKVCQWVAINIYENREPAHEISCRYCMNFLSSEEKSGQVFDVATGETNF